MKKAIVLVLAALAIPTGVALAAKPSAKHAPKVQYILKGTLSNYSAYDKVTQANGSIMIEVKHANFHGKALKGQTLTFAVDAKTKISLSDGLTTITNGDKGIVKIRAAKRIPAADLAATLQAAAARQVIDQGAPS